MYSAIAHRKGWRHLVLPRDTTLPLLIFSFPKCCHAQQVSLCFYDSPKCSVIVSNGWFTSAHQFSFGKEIKTA